MVLLNTLLESHAPNLQLWSLVQTVALAERRGGPRFPDPGTEWMDSTVRPLQSHFNFSDWEMGTPKA